MNQETASSGVHFNLLDEPWIEVIDLEGVVTEVSIKDAVLRSHELADVISDHPTERVAMIRMLLAFLHRAYMGPVDEDVWRSLWGRGSFDDAVIEAYADRWHERFWLFHDEVPFGQMPSSCAVKWDDWASVDLSREPFFERSGPSSDSRTPAEAARWVIWRQAIDPAGIRSAIVDDPDAKGGKIYGNSVGWLGQLHHVLIRGESLFETLMLNMIPWDRLRAGFGGLGDLPSWEKDPIVPMRARPSVGIPTGPVDAFTWNSRRLSLKLDDDGLVREVSCAGGPYLVVWEGQGVNFETHSLWRRSEAQSKKQGRDVYSAPMVRVDQQFWRGLSDLLPVHDTTAGTMAVEWWARLDLIGVLPARVVIERSGMTYGTNSAVLDREVGDSLMIPSGLLDEDRIDLRSLVEEGLHALDETVRAIGSLGFVLGKAQNLNEGSLNAYIDRAKTGLWADLDPVFRGWLVDFSMEETLPGMLAVASALARTRGTMLMESLGPEAWCTSGPMKAWLKFESRLDKIVEALGSDEQEQSA